MTESIIDVRRVSKVFQVPEKGQRGWRSFLWRRNRDVQVLNDISFSIGEGEFVGYIGPNGAGKSTTIKLLTGILYPTTGTIRVLGYDPNRDRYQYTYHIGVVFGNRSLLEYDIAVKETFELYRAIYELGAVDFRRRLEEFTAVLGLEELLHVPVRKLSLGQRMRCELAAALLHRPRVIFLDEPTIGLDALSKQHMRDFLTRINREEKVTIILTTHDMDDIEQLCERIIFIHVGNIVYDGALAELKARYVRNKVVEVVYDEPIEVPGELAGLVKEVDLTCYRFRVPREQTAAMMPRLLALGDARDVSIHEPRLEDVVKIIYTNGMDGEVGG